jgi:hypothetical protein
MSANAFREATSTLAGIIRGISPKCPNLDEHMARRYWI